MGLKTLLLASTAATAVGTAMQVRGIKEQAQASAAISTYEAKVYKLEEAARRRMGAEESKLMREKLRSTLKRQKVLIAKGGTTMRGSPMQIQLRTVEDMAYDIGMLAHAREMEARGFSQKAMLSLLSAKYTKRAGKLQARQTLIGGIGKIAMMGLQYKLRK